MELMEVFKFSDGSQLEIIPDECPESPREWDNIGTMICFHKRYTLGDKHDYKSDDYGSWNELAEAIRADFPDGVMLPLRLYDHSSIALSIGSEYPFNCPWDSGQVGFIVVSGEKIRKEYGDKPDALDRVRTYLEGEVETYNQYLAGDLWGFILRGPPCAHCGGQRKEVDSCWGFYGSDPLDNGMMDHLDEVYRNELKQGKVTA